jgi:hypothetical protein
VVIALLLFDVQSSKVASEAALAAPIQVIPFPIRESTNDARTDSKCKDHNQASKFQNLKSFFSKH